MIRIVMMILAAMLLSMITTLSIVTWVKTSSLEGQVQSVQKTMKGVNEKVTALSAAAEAKSGDGHGAHGPAHWSYEGEMGPDKWGTQFPVCGTGKSQSPVDIRGPFEASNNPIKVNYRPIPLKLLNNGHTIQVNAAPGNTLTVGSETYELLQFHFHRPSEELVEGKPSAMVVHFVHKSAAGKLAVIGLLLDQGAENKHLRAIWANAPKQEAPEQEAPGIAINLAEMLPSKLSYHSYEGSLTTPPCTEGVNFYILRTHGSVSREQLEAFPFKANARPTQPLNGRKILEH